MNKGLMRLLAGGLLGLVLGVGAEASSGAQVLGQVRLEGGLPVVGAVVVVFDVQDLRRGVLAVGTTDAAGEFALSLASTSSARRGFGRTSASSVESLSSTGLGLAQTPMGFRLGPNYPNPFNPATVIPYQLATGGYVRLEVFNLLGQRVATLVDGEQAAGAHTAVWTATDGVGRAVSAGVYVYRLMVDGQQQTGRMVLVDGGAGVRPYVGNNARYSLQARPTAMPSGTYGLVVWGEGLVPYLDADFRVGEGSVVVEMAAVGSGRGKVVQTEEPRLLGDVDRDGRITFFDAVLVMLYVLNPSVPLPVESEISLGNVDADGHITVGDAWLIATYLTDPSDPVLAGAAGIGQPIDFGGTTGERWTFPLPVQRGYDPMSMEFVWIGPGVFQMGSPNSERSDCDWCEHEGPLHVVEISRGFWLGRYEVTQGEWESVMGSNPSRHTGDARRPVEQVSWYDVHKFIGRLNDAAGDSLYRLPTEAEWEYACRAGTQTRWSLGDEDGDDESLLGNYAWYDGNNSPNGTKAVSDKLPNRWGLYDMHGNVWEWVQDWYDDGYYNSSPRVDPPGPDTGNGRVVRGGYFSYSAHGVRSAIRNNTSLGARSHVVGVRLLRIR